MYDDDNRLWKAKRGGTDEAVYLYDASGRVKEVTLGNGSKTTYEYTDRYQTSKVKTATSGGTTRAEYTYTYDSRMRCSQQVRNHLGETIDYTYDAANRLTDEDSGGSSGSPPITVPVRNLTWTYDDAGNRTSANDGSSTTNYTYNSESRLTAETMANGDAYAFANDANGNRTDRDFTPNGNGSPTVQETYGYDELNRLSSYVKTVTGSGTTANCAYSHMPTGERLSNNNIVANTTEWYMSDVLGPVTSYSQIASGGLTHTISRFNTATSGSICRITSSTGAKHYYVTDGDGSILHLLDANQAITNSEATDAWGNTVAQQSGQADTISFLQYLRRLESGLLTKATFDYDPRVALFITANINSSLAVLTANRRARMGIMMAQDPKKKPCPQNRLDGDVRGEVDLFGNPDVDVDDPAGRQPFERQSTTQGGQRRANLGNGARVVRGAAIQLIVEAAKIIEQLTADDKYTIEGNARAKAQAKCDEFCEKKDDCGDGMYCKGILRYITPSRNPGSGGYDPNEQSIGADNKGFDGKRGTVWANYKYYCACECDWTTAGSVINALTNFGEMFIWGNGPKIDGPPPMK